LTLCATTGLSLPVIVAEHTDPFREPLPEPWQRLRRLAYRRAACVVSVSAAIDGYFDWVPAARRAVIPNPVDLAELVSPAVSLDWPWPHAAIAMGRLSPEKGFDLLIESFAQLAGEFSDWGLVILGEGPLRGELESLVARRGLTGRVQLPGAIPQPGPTLKKADLFVLSSRWEAMPMALLEAMACGLPSVVTQCMGVMPDWLRSQENAILTPVDDVPKLAAALALLMRDAGLRRRLGENAAETVRPFALESVVGQWEALLAQVGCGSGRGGV
jgi:GalNAc-alpha-(1->4)-GalNAc-alpha-(1->3)-diNAcBac-PP-undecaprenol alpha-1,4-N-acetyl-D-galactosaminyltransferase